MNTIQNFIAACIGCGCDDSHACPDDGMGTPCRWLRVDYDGDHLGVCSACREHVARWDAGDRTFERTVAVRYMSEYGGVYICSDPAQPAIVVPVVSVNGVLYSIKLDKPLGPDRFPPMLTILGRFRNHNGGV